MDNEQWIPREQEFTPGGEWFTYIQGPSVAIAGWIPQISDPGALAPDLGDAWESRLDVRSLFSSTGNREPSQEYYGPGAFQQDLVLGDFRAALAIDQPKLYLDRNGRIVRHTFWRLARVGYTPFRLGNFSYKARGTKRVSARVEEQPNGVLLKLWIKVKIGRLGDLGAWMITGHRAPWAILMVQYLMSGDGAVKIEASGTRLPSQAVYVDWKRTCVHRAESCSLTSFDDFVQSGACADAPLFRIQRMTTLGRAVPRTVLKIAEEKSDV